MNRHQIPAFLMFRPVQTFIIFYDRVRGMLTRGTLFILENLV